MLATGAERLEQPTVHFYYFPLVQVKGGVCGWGGGLERFLGAYAEPVYVLGYECAFGG